MSDHPAIMDSNPDGKLILVVDDEFDVLSAYTMLFEYRGFRVRIAGNGAEALSVARRERPDIVISDYMMPVMNGADLCVAWRDDPALREIPFILASAGIMPRDLQPPCDAFFRKPVPFDTLLDEIDKLIARRG
ncbi:MULTISPECIES: response regulator [unclassified Duganella]|uniref:response regulator n=1 Tax=unclassified Duganella TaxID=2636909 RepID=UPI00087E456F|nr:MULTISPECIES: response regulator [unclassified Duganella]SDG04085.1 Response regulator receiver domain-containing protein [Duganella sp. OV458]SDJ01317.1 Response regulator receiver domain-containing protein [Duganella sp. OV510]